MIYDKKYFSPNCLYDADVIWLMAINNERKENCTIIRRMIFYIKNYLF